MDVRNSIDGSLQISNEVVAKIAKLAALEIDAWPMFLPVACRACAGC